MGGLGGGCCGAPGISKVAPLGLAAYGIGEMELLRLFEHYMHVQFKLKLIQFF